MPSSLPGAFILAYAKYGFSPFFRAWCWAAIRLLVIKSIGRGKPVGANPPRKAEEVTGMLGLKLEGSLVSALDDREVGVNGNFEAELLESVFDFVGAGEPWSGLDLSSDFSDGVLR